MLTLYVKTGCGYCGMVHETGKRLGLAFVEKNIADPEVTRELVARGGKRQVPYLVDDEKGVEMYESRDISDYLEKNYPKA